jgi:cell fate regulator YaaT (PSP1 superfamily)
MGCIGCSCSTGKDSSAAGGCKSNGGCSTGGCNRHNSYDWISAQGIQDVKPFDIVEVSFKNGSRKEFFKNPPFTRSNTGDWVIVESISGGYDVGTVSLSGDLVRLQMKRKRVRNDARLGAVVRKAHERDLERLDEVRREEKGLLVQARVIARTLGLNMKIGDVEFQGDGRKCTFYYTADGRVDFRELIRHYARDFKVKIEMRQIGARQESARIGGLGNCGRELCCSTWLTEFKSVNTAAARYQNLAINQTKLSGMCGRLKCCLNYELDTYIDALEDFPDRAERLRTAAGVAILIKTDVFKRLMFYTYAEDRGKFYAIHVDQIWEALDLIKSGKVPGSLDEIIAMAPVPESDEPDEIEPDFENVHDVIQLPLEQRKRKKKKSKSTRDRSQSAAAAVEKAAQNDAAQGRNQMQRRDDRNRRPDNRPQQGKPENRPPQQRTSSQPPRQELGAQQTKPAEQPKVPPQRPPQQPKLEKTPPTPPAANQTPTVPPTPKQDSENNPNRNRNKRKFKGRGPKKDPTS